MRARVAVLLCLVCAASTACLSGDRGRGRSAIASCEDTEAPVCWPRFPPDGDGRVIPRLSVLLFTGEINQNTTLARLGYPDRILFRLHRDLPQLKVVLVGSPASRYSGDDDVTRSPEGAFTWRALQTQPRFDWIEIGGAGYTHSPPGDTRLDHHEFAVDETGCNLDHARMGTPGYCRERLTLAREAYAAIGLPPGDIVLIRFPGFADSPAALEAASEAGFLALLGNRHSGEAGAPWWIAHPSGEILDLEGTKLTELAPATQDEAEAPAGPAMRRVERVIEQGGLLNLRAEIDDLFGPDGRATPAYRTLTVLVRGVGERYGPEVWYPGVRRLALWLDLRRHGLVETDAGPDAIAVRIEPPGSWSGGGFSLDGAAIAVRVPPEWTSVSNITVAARNEAPVTVPSRRWFWAGPRLVVIPFDLDAPLRIRVERG